MVITKIKPMILEEAKLSSDMAMQTQAKVLREGSTHQRGTHLVQKSCEGFSLETAFNSAFTWREKNSSQQQNDEKMDHMGRLSDMT